MQKMGTHTCAKVALELEESGCPRAVPRIAVQSVGVLVVVRSHLGRFGMDLEIQKI